MRERKGTMYRGAARVVPRSRRFNTLACTQSLSEGVAPPASMTRVMNTSCCSHHQVLLKKM